MGELLCDAAAADDETVALPDGWLGELTDAAKRSDRPPPTRSLVVPKLVSDAVATHGNPLGSPPAPVVASPIAFATERARAEAAPRAVPSSISRNVAVAVVGALAVYAKLSLAWMLVGVVRRALQ